MNPPLALRLGALVCGLVYLPLGLVWAYGLALAALPLGAAGWWLNRRARHLETAAGTPPEVGQRTLDRLVRAILIAGFAASAVALGLTR
jgi:hypothetical protein